MSIKCLPPQPLPAGVRYYAEIVREIAAAEGLTPTGWHYGFQPDAAEIEYKASVHEHCDPSKLVARRIDTGRAESSGWTIFRIAA
jgi:hypothetical protein